MGTDPILTETPIAVPLGAIICLIALTVTAWPVLVGHHATDRRCHHAVWGSWACLGGVMLLLLAELSPGLYGFLTLATIAAVATSTLLRSRRLPA